MDSDFWASRIAAAKRQYALQHHTHTSIFDRVSVNDYELEDADEMDVRPDFPCPYCYEDFDVVSLCSHIEDEHSSESRVIACPVCAVKVASDMISHITLQHGQLFKLHRRRRLRRLAVPNSQTLSALGRDLQEAHLQVILGGGGGFRSGNASAVSSVATDPFLSSLVMNFPTPELDEISKAVISGVDESSTKIADQPKQRKMSFDPSLSYEERQKRIKQAVGRAGFMQDLFLSTLIQD
uniref:Uncharacterized protein n=1 Tax=Kalanchoe fedtschenkoi TaxID=63787 RepID=A0A7N0R981_KALFE